MGDDEGVFVEQMASLPLFALLMFHAFLSPHLSIKWEECYQQHRWDLNRQPFPVRGTTGLRRWSLASVVGSGEEKRPG